jgi:2-oxoglutarate ferredoxin oxidoreductase subunit gamma
MASSTSSLAVRQHELIIAGFGGQGVLRLGQTLAAAALLEGREVVWTPAYGPEMRGGPAFCTVILSANPIGSPVVAAADTGIMMDRPSLPKFQGQVRASGTLLLNSSLVDPALARTDIPVYAVPANHLAEEIGEVNIANMVMLGAFLALTPLVQPASVLEALRATLPERRRHLLPLNEQALLAGAKAVAG